MALVGAAPGAKQADRENDGRRNRATARAHSSTAPRTQGVHSLTGQAPPRGEAPLPSVAASAIARAINSVPLDAVVLRPAALEISPRWSSADNQPRVRACMTSEPSV